MAGLLAAFGRAPRGMLQQSVVRMADAAAYRGRLSVWTAPGLALGVQAGDEGASLAVRKGNVVAAYGYVGNWSELVKQFRVDADATTSLADRIANLWEAGGPQACRAMRGEYRALVWIEGDDKLVVLGDLVGARPLVTAYGDGVRVLACEPRQVLAAARLKPRLDEIALMAAIMDDTPPDGRTLFAGVSHVGGGASWIFNLQDPAQKPRSEEWPLPFDDSLGHLSCEEAAEELFRRLLQAVRRALPATPFAVSLSGGLDSGAIVGMVGRLISEGAIDAQACLPVSLVYPGCSYDEYPFTAQTLAQTRLPGVFVDDRFSCPAAFAVQLIPQSDYLFGGTAHHVDMVAEAAVARGRRVVLNGVGGDEWLGGGDAVLIQEAAHGARLWAATTALLLQHPSPTGGRPLRQRVRQAINCLVSGLIHRTSKRQWRARPPWFSDEAWENYVNATAGDCEPTVVEGPWSATLARRLINLQKGFYFSFVGQRAAALGVELRHPLMDQDLIEFGLSVRGRWLLWGQRYKGLLRRALGEVLPKPVLQRVARTVFDDHIAASMPPRLQLGEPREWRLVHLGVLKPGGVDKLLDGLYPTHGQGRRPVRSVRRVWLVWIAELFCRHLESESLAGAQD